MVATSGCETAGDDDNNLEEQLAARDYEWSSSVIGETQARRKKLDIPLGDWSSNCATTCKPSQKFNYETGKTYTYDYDVRTETAMDGASENKALLAIRGRADIEVISQCDLVLVLRDMTIYESSPLQDDQLVPAPRSQELRRVLEATPLRFSYQDGVVAELCPDNREDGWALNVKRGVLSALQNSMERLEGSETVQEADVTGRCQAKYEVTSNGWYTMSIKRSKDLLGCTDRHDYIGSIQTTPYQMASDLQSLPLMKSEHQCTQEVSSRILRSSTCDETHTFRPFSSRAAAPARPLLRD
ncbi:vitellogenin-like [Pomacea canaliculata]|uniref:vitellogenin-like n=1 Tax=Pomacea canaliculata TaxID=400727 RepID=UPI000D72607C|nr:vitellogenin-like [Pomacea canaliculata]